MKLEFRKITPFGHALPLTDIQADFEINRPVRYRNAAKRNYFHKRTDRRTDGQVVFSKKEKTTKDDTEILVIYEMNKVNHKKIIATYSVVGCHHQKY